MAEDLSILIKSKLDTSGAEQDLNNFLNSNNNHTLNIPVHLDQRSANEAGRTAADIINRTAGRASNIRVGIDVDDNALKDFERRLSAFGVDDVSIKDAVKHLKDGLMAVTKISEAFVETSESAEKLKKITIEGVTADGKRVSQALTLNKSKQVEWELAKKITKEYRLQAQQARQQSTSRPRARIRDDSAAASRFRTSTENQIRSLESRAFNRKNPLTGNEESEIRGYVERIRTELSNAGDSITGEVRNTISDLVSQANNRLAEIRASAETATNLRTRDVANERIVQGNELNTFVEQLRNAGILTEEMQEEIMDLRTALDNVVDANGMDAFLNQFEIAESRAKTLKEEIQALHKTQGQKLATTVQTTKLPQLDAIGNVVDGAGDSAGVAELSAQIDTLKTKYQSFITELRTQDLSQARFTEIAAELKLLDAQLTKTATSAKKFDGSFASNQTNARVTASVSKMKAQLADMEVNWNAALQVPEFKNAIEEMKNKLNSVDGVNLSRVQAEFQELRANIKAAGLDCQSFGAQLKDAVSKLFSFVSITDVLMTIKRMFTSAIENVKNLDTAMVELKKVTDLTASAYDKFLANTSSRAKELGTTISNLVASTADFSRLGYNLSDATSMAEAANIYLKVGDEIADVNEATESLVSTTQAYGYSASEVMSIVDKLNAAGNAMAISSGGIGIALQHSAAALSSANNTLDESIALIATANRVVQDPSAVGNMWKTVSMRIRSSKAELEAAGEDTEGIVESTAQLQKMIKSMTGFDILEADKKTFKSTYDIVVGIAEKWSELEDIEQANMCLSA